MRGQTVVKVGDRKIWVDIWMNKASIPSFNVHGWPVNIVREVRDDVSSVLERLGIDLADCRMVVVTLRVAPLFDGLDSEGRDGSVHPIWWGDIRVVVSETVAEMLIDMMEREGNE